MNSLKISLPKFFWPFILLILPYLIRNFYRNNPADHSGLIYYIVFLFSMIALFINSSDRTKRASNLINKIFVLSILPLFYFFNQFYYYQPWLAGSLLIFQLAPIMAILLIVKHLIDTDLKILFLKMELIGFWIISLIPYTFIFFFPSGENLIYMITSGVVFLMPFSLLLSFIFIILYFRNYRKRGNKNSLSLCSSKNNAL